ncbi:hypothetical protein WJ972_19975 [Achromobacter insuavis]
MNYRDPQLRARLAADYVSGAMRGGARRRFEGLMAADANLRRQVRGWEDDIYPLLWSLPGRTPPGRVWRVIESRLRPGAAPGGAAWRSGASPVARWPPCWWPASSSTPCRWTAPPARN